MLLQRGKGYPANSTVLATLHALAQARCNLVVVIHLHGAIDPRRYLISVPENICVSIARAVPIPSGCVGFAFPSPIYKDIPVHDAQNMLAPKTKATASAVALQSRAALFVKKTLPMHHRGHCTTVPCAPSQPLYDKVYYREASASQRVIEVVNFETTGDAGESDVLKVMINNGFGQHKLGYGDTIARSEIIDFFKVLGAKSLTIFEAACTSVFNPNI